MTSFDKRLAVAAGAVLLCAMTWPARAESSASSASSGASASVGSVSDSLKNSSDSSSRNKNNLADGDYRVIDIAALPARPGFARMTLQAVTEAAGDDGRVFLELPQQAVDDGRLASGHTVRVRQRPYGFEFATRQSDQQPLQAFFLVLVDDWYRELQTNAVVL